MLALISDYLANNWQKLAETDVRGKKRNWHELSADKRRALLVETVLEFVNALQTSLDRIVAYRAIVNLFKDSISSNKSLITEVKNIKLEFKKHKKLGWKSQLLSVDYTIEHREYNQQLDFDNSASTDVCYNKERFRQYNSKNNVSVVVGSSFVTNQAQLHANQSHVLDAFYCVTASNNRTIFAIGDGLGGHVIDAYQDKMIARAAHFATKHAVRLFASYKCPNTLKTDIPKLLHDLEKEVESKSSESTTLLCCQTFYDEVTGNYRIVGFNLGDNALITWHPAHKQVKTIAKLWRSLHGTAQFPISYKPFEIQIIDEVLPVGTIIFPLTDGLVDNMPVLKATKVFPNDLQYDEISLDGSVIGATLSTLPATSELEKYIESLLKDTLQNLNIQKCEAIQQQKPVKMGDDIIIAAIALTKPSILHQMKMLFFNDFTKPKDACPAENITKENDRVNPKPPL